MREAPEVAVLVDTATGWGRRLVRGVTNYARNHGRWHVWVEPRGQEEHLRVPAGWRGQGVIARVGTGRMAAELGRLGVPVVNVSGIEVAGARGFPRVTTNDDATARLAAEHFLERGYRRFAYVGPLRLAWVRRHAEAFGRVAAAFGAGCSFHDYRHDYRHDGRAGAGWAQRRRALGDWLAGLAKPVGIFSWATGAGAQVLDVCRYRGLATPDDVAVLGGDDDPLLCDTTAPPLSGVVVASEQIGFRAAARLDALMAGAGGRAGGGAGGGRGAWRRAEDARPELINPITITTRGSTEAYAIEDDELRRAMIYLRQNAYRAGVTVGAVADAVPMARRSLERKFGALVGRTPLEEIRRLRLARVRELLALTDRSVDDIAGATGFGTPEYMTAIFRRFEKVTPLRYRRQVRGA